MSTQEWSKRLITRSGCLFSVRPANADDEAELIAAATLDCDMARKHGGVHLVIRSDFKHDGVSWELLAHLVRYAEAIGVTSLESVETPENHAAIALQRDMGFSQQIHPDNPALIVMHKPLGEI